KMRDAFGGNAFRFAREHAPQRIDCAGQGLRQTPVADRGKVGKEPLEVAGAMKDARHCIMHARAELCDCEFHTEYWRRRSLWRRVGSGLFTVRSSMHKYSAGPNMTTGFKIMYMRLPID